MKGQENGEMVRGRGRGSAQPNGEARDVQNTGLNGGSSQIMDGVANEEGDYVQRQKVLLCVLSYYWISVYVMYFFPNTHCEIFTFLFGFFLSTVNLNNIFFTFDWNNTLMSRSICLMAHWFNACLSVYVLNIYPILGFLTMVHLTLLEIDYVLQQA